MRRKPAPDNKSKSAGAQRTQGEGRGKARKSLGLQKLVATNGEDCVAICIHKQQPTVRIADSDTLSALGVQPVPMESCVNNECEIPEDQKFGGEITGSSTVGWIRSEVKRRKQKQ